MLTGQLVAASGPVIRRQPDRHIDQYPLGATGPVQYFSDARDKGQAHLTCGVDAGDRPSAARAIDSDPAQIVGQPKAGLRITTPRLRMAAKVTQPR